MRDDRPILQVTAFPEGKDGQILDLSNEVMSFSLTDHSAKMDTLSFTIENADLRNFDDPKWRRGVVLEVTWGYPGLTDSRRCIIKKISGGEKLKIEAKALSAVMHTVTKCRVWENMTLTDIAKKIEFEYASILFYEAAVQKDKNLQTLGDNFQIIHAVQAAETDAQFLARLAKKYGLIFRVGKNGKINFSEPNLNASPIRTLTWRGGAGDWEDFEVQNDPAGAVGAVTVKAIDPVTKQEVEHRADNQTTKRDGLSEKVEVVSGRTGQAHYETRTTEAETTENSGTLESGKPHLQAVAEGKFKASQRRAVKLWGRCVGDPRLTATRLIVVEGLGKLVSGTYRLVETWHDIDEQGKYTTTWVAKSDGTGGYSDKNDVASQASKNEQKAPDATTPEVVVESVLVEPVSGRTGQSHYEFRRKGDAS